MSDPVAPAPSDLPQTLTELPSMHHKLKALTQALHDIEPDSDLASILVLMLVEQTVTEGRLQRCDVMETLSAVPVASLLS